MSVSKDRAQRTPRQAKRLLEGVLEALQDGVCVLDHELTIVEVNRRMEGLFPDEMPLVGRNCYAAYRRGQPPGARHRTAAAKAADAPAVQAVPYAGREQPTRWLRISSVPLTDARGRVVGLVEHVKETTEEVRLEAALAESQERVRCLHEAPFEPIGIHHEGLLIEVNRAATELTGFEVNELLGMDGLLLVAPEDRDTVLHNIRTGCEDPYEVVGVRKDGTRYPLEIRGRNLSSHGRTLRVTGFRDLTESSRAKAALEEAHDIINMSPAVVFLWRNEEGWPVEFVTENVKEAFGYTADEFSSGAVTYAETVHPADLDRVAGEVARFSAEPSRQRFTHEPYRIVTKDGNVKWLDDRTFMRRDADGRITHFQGVVVDITDRQVLAAQLQHAQKMEAIGTLAGGVAHEFNNLMQAILGFVQGLMLDGDESSPVRRELEGIEQAARSGGDLTQRLLTFSRTAEARLHPVDLNAEVEKITTLLMRTIPRMIAIELELEEALKPINGDPAKLEQVVMNLALNAKDAMEDGGRLVITTRNATLTDAYCRHHVGAKPGEYVLLRVADSGHGMDQVTLERMFEPFFTTKAVGRGSGLGLPCVYGIVKEHDGHITCRSQVGEGTTFEIYLPALEEPAEPGRMQTAGELQGGTETILLVDDDDAVRESVSQILEHFGYVVRTAADGESALDLYRRDLDAIDLVILDLIMPGMGGQKCLQRMLEINPRAKVLLVSGHSAGHQVGEVLAAGARGFVGKPYSASRILLEIRNLLDA